MKIMPKYITRILVVVVSVLGLSIGYHAINSQISYVQSTLLQRAETVSKLLSTSANDIESLKGAKSDMGKAEYQRLRRTLVETHDINSDLRYIYITRMNSKGQVTFLVDAEPEDSDDFSAPGDIYHQASGVFRNTFFSRDSTVEGPAADGWGIWFSGLSPIIDHKTGAIIGVVGLDQSASQAILLAALYGLSPIIFSISIIVVILLRQKRMEINKTASMLRQKAQFITIASHDIRSPLTGQLWGLQTVMPTLEKSKDKNVVSLAHSLYSGCEQIIGTVSSILNTIQMENECDSGQIDKKPADIIQMIRNAADLHGLSAQAKDVKIDLAGKWPAHFEANVESISLSQAIGNIINNGVKYTRAGSIVKIQFKTEPDAWSIIVTDQGDGIPQEDLDKIGEQFFRGKAASGQIVGTGLGMYFTKQIIAKHGGRLEIKSSPGKGTTITVIMPK